MQTSTKEAVMRRLGCIGSIAIALWASAGVLDAQHGTTGGQWRTYNGDSGSTKYAPLDQINKNNVTTLRILWRRPAVDPTLTAKDPKLRIPTNFRATPLMVNGLLYAPNGVGLAEAFNPATGKTVWVQEPVAPNELEGDSTRGVAYWTDGRDERILVQRGEYLYAVNAKTGKGYPDFGERGRINLTHGLGPLMTKFYWTGAPFVIRDVVIIGASMTDSPGSKDQPRGDVRAFDVRTGALRWQFHTIPQAEDLGYVYMPVTSPTSDIYGGHRLGNNLFGQSLVCVKADTGERVWHFQLTHHDLWDFDPPAAPMLADIRVDGRPIKAVVQVTKQGFAYVFDRVTGKPVWPIEERPVPQSSTPGERTSPTQPFPTKPPPFDRQGSTADNLIDFTPQLRQEALDIVKQYVTGPLFTPPSIRGSGPNQTKGTIQLPGSVGGADWQGAAFDPESGLMYVPSITTPFVADLLPGDPAKTNLRFTRGTREWVGGPRGLPLFKPPYGRITAIDLNRGEHRWMVANGDGPRNNPAIKQLNLPPLGNPGRAAPLVTRTLLFIGEGSPAMANNGPRLPPGMPPEISPGWGGNGFKALDKATGATLWRIELPAGTTGAPMTYMYQGKQYVVVAVGDQKNGAEWIALGLP
ncbi:MAG: pyrroloquinoline quinone-dependent dehydrogenase [Acidobacteria bacterium]|nr:MAG: pyrroloquinoline quinone-dependent dehydrogenase [Acidobacteriota bacterium]